MFKKLLIILIIEITTCFCIDISNFNYIATEAHEVKFENVENNSISQVNFVSTVQEMHNNLELDEQINEEIRLGEMELVAQLVQAEAGNQSLEGKRLVADVVYNRVDSQDWPNTVEDVIFQSGQFSVINNGAFNKAAWNITDDCFKVSEEEYYKINRYNTEVLYFNSGENLANGKFVTKVGAHHFGS